MISQSLVDALNEQLKHELYSSYLYLAMSAYCDDQNLPGFAHWMRLHPDPARQVRWAGSQIALARTGNDNRGLTGGTRE